MMGLLHNEENKQVNPNSEIGKPAESLKCSNLSNYHTSRHKDDKADDEADRAFRYLRDRLTVAENQDGDREEKLNCLE